MAGMVARGGHTARWDARRRERQRDQHVHRSRHRRSHGAHGRSAARHRDHPGAQCARCSPSRCRSLAFIVLWAGANLLSAVLALSCRSVLRRRVLDSGSSGRAARTSSIGGAAGAVPVFVGWAAVAGLAVVHAGRAVRAMFLWTPPALLGARREVRRRLPRRDVPMLPSVVPIEARRAPDDLVHGGDRRHHARADPVADLGWIYGVDRRGARRDLHRWHPLLRRNPTPAASMRLFGFSITYVTLLFGSMMLDVFVEYGW